MSTPAAVEEAENQRQKGNDAFKMQDWQKAVKYYRESISLDPASKNSAKAWGNLAAALCKISMYEDANRAAARATSVDPTWAKGWWRRGVVEELQKDFIKAHVNYFRAMELASDKKEKSFFKEAMKKVEKRINVKTIQKPDGTVEHEYSVSGPGVSVIPTNSTMMDKVVGLKAWRRFRDEGGQCTGGQPDQLAFFTRQAELRKCPTSYQFIMRGMFQWYMASCDARAYLLYSCGDAEARMLQHRVTVVENSPEIINNPQLRAQSRMVAERMVLGGSVPSTGLLIEFINSINKLLGDNLIIGADSQTDAEENFLPPIPGPLRRMGPAYMFQAMLASIFNQTVDVTSIFGTKAKMSPAIISAVQTFQANMRLISSAKLPQFDSSNTPEDVLKYCKKMLKQISWNQGMRKFVALQYQGSVLYGVLLRFTGNVAEALKQMKWGRTFMKLADEAFNVTKDGAFAEKGCSFRASFRIGLSCTELKTHHALRDGSLYIGGGSYPVDDEFSLALEIIEMAKNVDLSDFNVGNDSDAVTQPILDKIDEVAHYRMPLAYAHGLIAHTLGELNSLIEAGKIPFEGWTVLCNNVDLVGPDDDRTIVSVIAEHYRLAAENELPDSLEGSVLWWTYGHYMARSGKCRGDNDKEKGGYTLGELRNVIKKAEAARKVRDISLFGPDDCAGGTFEMATKMVASHFHSEDDDFLLPELKYEDKDGKRSMVINGFTLCEDISNLEKIGREYLANRNGDKQEKTKNDTSELEQEHGAAREEVKPLTTLCIRELHNQDNAIARGEADPALIVSKAMKAGLVDL
uniref:Uncharacterized protein n=1 Tax=Leptocylindrus danicus TaxID=163516 RepID=A0A7S2LTP3_9STRA|mmetsp:Transcript_988/g.1397  ORF Transcript_988/g.1397 Transcript_988/m.1397 type:complete len:802 (+) Transcript_988:75-2480(+)